MTLGYHVIPPNTPGSRQKKTLPYPYCRSCTAQLGGITVVPIDDSAHPATTCRGCKAKLRAWR